MIVIWYSKLCKGFFSSKQGHQRSNCTIQWEYQGSTIQGCSHDPTPSASDEKCQAFIKKTKFEWPDNIDEVALVDEQSNKVATTCYRHNPGRQVNIEIAQRYH